MLNLFFWRHSPRKNLAWKMVKLSVFGLVPCKQTKKPRIQIVTSYLCALVRRGSFSFLLSLVNKACDEEMPERNQVS